MKRILMLGCIVLLLCQTVAFAHEMPDEEMYISGITVGDTLGYAKMIFGNPEQVQRQPYTEKRDIGYLYLSDGLQIRGETEWRNTIDEDDLIIWNVFANNEKWETPSGIRVGMPYTKVVELFGEGRLMYHSHRNKPYEYKGQSKTLSIFVDPQNDLIKSISVVKSSFGEFK